jgi:hypothetical protein
MLELGFRVGVKTVSYSWSTALLAGSADDLIDILYCVHALSASDDI